jgi:hypothetical protein
MTCGKRSRAKNFLRKLNVMLENQSVKVWIIAEGSQIMIMLRTNPKRGLKIQSTLKRLQCQID